MTDVKTLRERLGISRAKFAEAMGVSPALIQSWELGRRTPNEQSQIMLELLKQKPGMLALMLKISADIEGQTLELSLTS
jgi:putative transcriptional regulator